MTRNVFKLIGIASLVVAIGLSAIGCVINPDDGPRVVQITVTGIPAEYGGKTFEMRMYLAGDTSVIGGSPSEASVPQGGGTVTFTITDDEASVDPAGRYNLYIFYVGGKQIAGLGPKTGLKVGANTIPWSEFTLIN